MTNKTLRIFVGLNGLFLVCAALMISIPAIGHQKLAGSPSIGSVAQVLLLDECPLTAAMVNGIFMLITVAISIPGILMKRNHAFLTIHSWLLIFNAIFTLGVGLAIWYNTLQTRANLAPVWNRQTPFVQSMLQHKFDCCGYKDSTVYIQDGLCTSNFAAAALGPCVGPFSAFANQFLDVVFTAMFGFCAIDGLLLLSGLCVLKNRAEMARYEQIDEKRGMPGYGSQPYSRF